MKFVSSISAPLYWVIRNHDGSFQTRNGSAFFLDAGEGVFAVTAAHVIDEWRKHFAEGIVLSTQLGCEPGIPIDFQERNRIIDIHSRMDIATFSITNEEIAAAKCGFMTGSQRTWPPNAPELKRGVYCSGYPGVEVLMDYGRREISFGTVACGGVATSVNELDVSSQIERENLIPVLGNGIPAENYDFGGISGGPMICVVESSGIRSWKLAGVIYEGPRPIEGGGIGGLEIIKARRAHFIFPNGSLDISRWQVLSNSPDVETPEMPRHR